MAACFHYLRFLPVLFFFFPVAYAQVAYHNCLTTGLNYTGNSTYQHNLNRLLASVRENSSFTRFFNTSVGQNPDQVHGLVQCHKDISAGDCSTCADSAASQILQLCPNSKTAVIWFDDCLLRYSSFNFFGIVDESKQSYGNQESIPDPTQFKELLRSLFNNLSTSATTNNYSLMYATGYAWYTDNITLYALVECTEDLSLKSCESCLKTSITAIWQCCSGTTGARILSSSCVIRYDINPFYGNLTPAPARAAVSPTPPPPAAANQSTPSSTPDKFTVSSGDSSKTAVIVGVSVSAFLLVLLCILLVCVFRRRKTRRQGQTPERTVLLLFLSALCLLHNKWILYRAWWFISVPRLLLKRHGGIKKGVFSVSHVHIDVFFLFLLVGAARARFPTTTSSEIHYSTWEDRRITLLPSAMKTVNLLDHD